MKIAEDSKKTISSAVELNTSYKLGLELFRHAKKMHTDTAVSTPSFNLNMRLREVARTMVASDSPWLLLCDEEERPVTWKPDGVADRQEEFIFVNSTFHEEEECQALDHFLSLLLSAVVVHNSSSKLNKTMAM